MRINDSIKEGLNGWMEGRIERKKAKMDLHRTKNTNEIRINEGMKER
jgi:hypothetical protein